jgi:hypothetical protein
MIYIRLTTHHDRSPIMGWVAAIFNLCMSLDLLVNDARLPQLQTRTPILRRVNIDNAAVFGIAADIVVRAVLGNLRTVDPHAKLDYMFNMFVCMWGAVVIECLTKWCLRAYSRYCAEKPQYVFGGLNRVDKIQVTEACGLGIT